METIGICGIGQMGSACALAFRRFGYDVRLWARDVEKLDRVTESIDAMDRWCDENTSMHRSDGGSLTTVPSLDAVDDQCNVILDCIIEVMDQKVELLSRFPNAKDRGALFLSATSALSITEMAQRSGLDSQLIGAHFWNPPHLIPVVEMVRGEASDDERVEDACALMRSIGKVPIVCRDVPGFVGNRLLHAMWREALHMVQEGVCSAEDVDRITKLTFALRLPMLGPIENMDYVDPCLPDKIESGDLGVKSCSGFYDWSTRDSGAMIRRRDAQVVRQIEFLKEWGEL